MPNSLTLAQSDPRTSIDIGWWNMAKEQAAVLVKTGFLPQAIKTPEQALAVMLKGKELGLPPMYALSNIVVIQGKPTANAELMLALVYRDHGKDAIRIAESTNDSCTVEWKSWGEVKSYTFTMDDAKRAGLLSNQTWTKYPAAMLRARCISAACRMAFPESIGGLYGPDEMGAGVEVDADGVVRVASQPVERPRASATVGADAAPATENAYDPATLEVPQHWFKKLFAMGHEAGMDSDKLHAFLGRESFKGMTRDEFGQAIDQVQALLDDISESDAMQNQKDNATSVQLSVDGESVDADTGEILPDTEITYGGITSLQVETILTKSLDRGFSEQVVRDRIQKIYGKDMPDLTSQEADEVIQRIDAPAK